jgi:hypothetical protein
MPDIIELARKAEYVVTPPTRYMPDGIHVYKGTAPMEIPISFKLASNDIEFCPRGAYSLLQMAALLHSLVLPLGVQGQNVEASISLPTEAEIKAQTASNPVSISISARSAQEDSLRPPVTCGLELMWTESGGPGIVCIGYVKDVSAKFAGPWMKGPNQSFNLPSFCDFSFTFVHAPGYGNDYTKTGEGLGQNVHAYAQDVMNKFYNTFELSKQGNKGGGYRGLDALAPENLSNAPKYTLGSLPSVFSETLIDTAPSITYGPNGQLLSIRTRDNPLAEVTQSFFFPNNRIPTQVTSSAAFPTQPATDRAAAVVPFSLLSTRGH